MCGVDEGHPGVGVARLAAPLGAAVVARKYDGRTPDAKWREGALAAHLRELFEGPGPRFRGARREQVPGEQLSRERCRLRRNRLGVCRDLAGHIARGELAI